MSDALPEPPELCISVAARPGRFGLLVHNAGYRALGLNFVYRPCGADDIGAVIAAVRVLKIRGCSVSMPFKEAVLAHLDEIDPSARRVGAANTVVNRDGRLIGHNTDIDGVRAALATFQSKATGRAVVLGAGGAARAVLVALEMAGIGERFVCARSSERSERTALELGATPLLWARRNEFDADLLINATPVGMAPDTAASPVTVAALAHYGGVIDLVATPPQTMLVRAAREAGLPCVDGLTVALHQAARQFTLYTGRDAPLEAMRSAARQLAP